MSKILIAPDLHLRDSNFSTIGGYTDATEAVYRDIINELREGSYTHFVSTGDLHDKGYRSQTASYSHINMHREASDIVNGNYYICLGNHFYLERDSNPTMHIIQPHPFIKPKEPVYANNAVVKVVDKIVVGCTQISFFHYNKDDKLYFREREPGVKFHVGIYHDDICLPNSIKSKAFCTTKVTSDYVKQVYSNIDLAIFGHIHVKVGVEHISVNGRKVPIIVPGSCGITSSKVEERHKSVDLPVLEISDNELRIGFKTISTHSDMLKFYTKKVAGPQKGIFQNPELTREEQITEMKKAINSNLSVIDYLQEQGCKQKVIDTVSLAIRGSLTIADAVKHYSREEI